MESKAVLRHAASAVLPYGPQCGAKRGCQLQAGLRMRSQGCQEGRTFLDRDLIVRGFRDISTTSSRQGSSNTMYGNVLSDPAGRIWKRGQNAWLIAWFQPSIVPCVASPAP